MELVSSGGGRARALVLPLCLAAIVLGILGMHAFAQHSVTDVATPGSTSGSMSGSMSGSASEHSSAVLSHAASSDAAVPSSHSEGGHSTGEMLMMCAAMLLGVAVGALLVLHLWRVARSRVACAPVPRAAQAARPNRAGAGPPYVWEFSVVRC